jgi:2-dehydropantoate 2-reductase
MSQQGAGRTAGAARICVVGAGAIGGFFAARLAGAGHEVSVLARGALTGILRQQGIRLTSGGVETAYPVTASDRAAELGVQDIVIITVKAPALASVAAAIGPLIGPETIVIPALNGIPWWFFLNDGVALSGTRLKRVDPDGSIEARIPLQHVIGAVVIASCSTSAPGQVVHASGNKVVFGEPSGQPSERADRVAAIFAGAGFTATASPDIRRDVWAKLLGNACFNPVSLLTQSPTDLMLADPGLEQLFVGMMNELLALSRALGIDLAIAPEQRIGETRKLGHIKTSMLQDLESGRSVELDSIVGAAIEAADAAKVDVPLLRTVFSMAVQRARMAGIYDDA